MPKFFYDSYAIISYLDGEQKFKKYFSIENGVTTSFCIMEVYYSLLKRFRKEKAEEIINSLFEVVINPTFEEIKVASEFRFENKRKEFSYSDCLGYVVAKKRKLRFLTGDVGFKDMANVEFVK